MNNQTTSVTPTNNQTAAVTPKNNRTVSVAPKNNQTTAVTPQVTQVTYTYAQKMANLQKAFPDFSSNQYQIMMETDPNIWKSAPNSKIPEALIEPLAQAGNTSFSGNIDTASLRQLKAMDVDKTRGELRYYNQHGTKPYYAPILNGTVIAPGLLWDQRRQAFRQFNGGESIGQNWVYGVYDPLPAFDISNNYGQVYLSMSDQDYRKAVARSTWTKPTTLYPSSQAVYTDSRGNNIYRPTHSGSALLASPVTPATGDGNIPSYAAAATATTLPDWTYLGHTLLNFSGRQGYDVNGIFVTLGEPGYPE